ncbi:hypothetical protein MKD33_14690, partial [Chromobacterium piscinae]
AAARAQAMLA